MEDPEHEIDMVVKMPPKNIRRVLVIPEDAFDGRLYKAMANRDLNALMTILNDLRSIEMNNELAPVPSRVQARGPLENAPRGSETETPPPDVEPDREAILQSRKEMKEREQRIQDDHPELLLQKERR